MGNARVRHLLVESAWTYRHPPRVGKAKLPKLEGVSPRGREIAWKAQSRLTARYRALTARGKKTPVTVPAPARRLAARMSGPGSCGASRGRRGRPDPSRRRRRDAHTSRTGGGEATAGELPSAAMWSTRSTPAVR